jgi:hypothetical protein
MEDDRPAFLALLERDASDSLAALELVLAQPTISSQLIDNLNHSRFDLCRGMIQYTGHPESERDEVLGVFSPLRGAHSVSMVAAARLARQLHRQSPMSENAAQ